MFVIKSSAGKVVKDAITRKPKVFDTKERAETFCTSMIRTAVACDKIPNGWHVVPGEDDFVRTA